MSPPPSPHSSSRCRGALHTGVNTRGERACWVDGCGGLAHWLEGDYTGMAAEMRKSCKVVRKSKEDDWTGSAVTGTRRRPLYCCWTTMRTLSHFPEDCGRKLVTFVSNFFCHVCRHYFLFCLFFSFMPLIVFNTKTSFCLFVCPPPLQLEPCVQIGSWLLVYLCVCVCARVCVCSRDTCMSDRIVFVLLRVCVQN